MTAPEDTAPSALDEMLQGLMADGVIDSAGSFTINHERAREQLGQFQFEEPERYVLGLVQVATMRGASRISFAIDSDDMVMTFDGPPYPLAELEAVFSDLQADGEDRTASQRWELAMALTAAESLGVRFVGLLSGDGTTAAGVTIQPDAPYRFHEAESSLASTRIHVKTPFDPLRVIEATAGPKTPYPLEAILRQRCGYSSIPIEVGGKVVSHGLTLPDAVAQVDFSADGVAGAAAYRKDSLGNAELRLVRHGVWVDTARLPGATGFVAVVESAALRQDLSHASVVQDAGYEAAVAAARAAQPRALRAFCAAYTDAGDPPGFSATWARSVLRSALEEVEDPAALRQDDPPTLAHTLAQMKVFRVLVGASDEQNHVSVRDLYRWLDDGHTVGYLPVFREDPFGGAAKILDTVTRQCWEASVLAIRLASHDDEALVRHLFGDRLARLIAGDEQPTPDTDDRETQQPRPVARWGGEENADPPGPLGYLVAGILAVGIVVAIWLYFFTR